jgi:hypothetical protein
MKRILKIVRGSIAFCGELALEEAIDCLKLDCGINK